MNTLLKLLAQLLGNSQVQYNGTAPDTRPASEKEKDYTSQEIYGFAPAPAKFRVVNSPDEWARYQVRNQDGSGSCVANTVAKMLEIKRKMGIGDVVKFSHAPIYINRSNRPSGGMIGTDALQLAVKLSSCPETVMPSENKNDAQLDAMSLPADFHSQNNYVRPTNYMMCPIDFDYIASMVEQEGAVMIWVDTDYKNWCKDFPTAGGRGGGVRHSITVVDCVTYKGEQYLVIEDSWGRFGLFNGQRLLSREFFADAVFFAGVLTSFIYNEQDSEQFAPFNTVMRIGEATNEVKRLQDYLKKKGFFPSNSVSTGYYGNVTAKGVYAFQIKFNVASLSELDALKGKIVGKKTLAVINKNL